MRKILLLILLGSVTLTLSVSGCAAFRRTFSRTPESMRRTPPPTKKKSVHRPGSSGDQLFDTVFHREKKQSSHISSSALSDREKALVESGFAPLPRGLDDDPDVRRIREQNQKSRTSRRDEVFGTRDGHYFGGANR